MYAVFAIKVLPVFSIERSSDILLKALGHLRALAPLRCLSTELRSKLDETVKAHPVLVFMKGTKEAPQCGFSRAVVQILELQGVPKFSTVNVLADEEIRTGIKEYT